MYYTIATIILVAFNLATNLVFYRLGLAFGKTYDPAFDRKGYDDTLAESKRALAKGR